MKEKGNDGVSPVVGVMLMLVVTIVIAAIIAAFAGGFADNMESTPNAIITYGDIKTYDPGWGNYLDNITFTHKGGDTLILNDINVVLKVYGTTYTYSIANGNLIGSSTKAVSVSTGGKFTIITTDRFSIYDIMVSSGVPVEYSVIDVNTGGVIFSDKIIVP